MSHSTTDGQAAQVPSTENSGDAGGVRDATAGYWGASRLYALGVVLFGAVGLFMSGLIMYDKIELMKDPTFSPACTINDVISCTESLRV